MSDGNAAVLALHAAGVSLVVDASPRVPRVLHWGASLEALDDADIAALRDTAEPAVLNNSPDVPRVFSLWPTEFEGWLGTQAQAGHAAGTATTPRPELVDTEFEDQGVGGGRMVFHLTDAVTSTRSCLVLDLDPYGVLAVDMSIECDNSKDVPYTLGGLRAFMPIPERATEVLDFAGKWCRERSPQHGAMRFGSHVRRAHRGKPGHDAPYFVVAGTPDLAFRRGEAWAAHLAWSGDTEYVVERLPEGAGVLSSVLGVGEDLRSGEIILGNGDRYEAPTALFVWSDHGLDGLAERVHDRLRARPHHPTSARPLVLNTWEAVYYDHDLGRLADLVDRAARVGVERVVLDDGWFLGRRHDGAGLGDWVVDGNVWPNGLSPLADLVHGRGMQFGLWFEPEMISLDSELAREHPDWVLGPRQGLGAPARHQYVLDIARKDAWSYVLERVSAIVTEYGIDYIKWDHNRDLTEPVGRRTCGDRPVVHEQTQALYRMLDELHGRHPRLEIETCSGGGGRVDLGILDHTDRLWPSDCNDPVERLQIERWTRMLVPPELIGSHVGADRSHTTGRRTDLSFRLAIALTSHAGIEWDLRNASEEDLQRISAWAATYREFRPLIHSGRIVNADLADETAMLSGIVARDGSRALFTWARLSTSAQGQSGRVRLPGLDPNARYVVRVRDEFGDVSRHETADPAWVTAASTPAGASLPGSVLAVAGVPLPTLNPEQAMIFDIKRTP
jgi:alpha-galactosidase